MEKKWPTSVWIAQREFSVRTSKILLDFVRMMKRLKFFVKDAENGFSSITKEKGYPMKKQEIQNYLQEIHNEGIALRQSFFEKHSQDLFNIASQIAYSLFDGRKIMVCGNGGSASDSLHFVGELVGKLHEDRNPFSAICLNADVASMTAIANDYGYEEVFARQVKALGRRYDHLLCISTSGNSENVCRAAKYANRNGIRTIGLLGRDGGKLKSLCNDNLIVEGSKDSGRCQEVHIFALHALADLIEKIYHHEILNKD